MKLRVDRIKMNENTTTGSLFINDKYMCDTLEDPVRDKKIYGRTAIPQGTYKLELNQLVEMNKRYKERFPDIHKGMLHVMDVPNYTWILIHCGATAEDTAGCLLLGKDDGADKIKNSSDTYKRVYPIIAGAISRGEEVTIEYINIIN
jgi:hypothetical protein